MDGTGNPCIEMSCASVGERGLEPATPGPPDQYLFPAAEPSSEIVVSWGIGWNNDPSPQVGTAWTPAAGRVHQTWR
jgi:hypothetical protein